MYFCSQDLYIHKPLIHCITYITTNLTFYQYTPVPPLSKHKQMHANTMNIPVTLYMKSHYQLTSSLLYTQIIKTSLMISTHPINMEYMFNNWTLHKISGWYIFHSQSHLINVCKNAAFVTNIKLLPTAEVSWHWTKTKWRTNTQA